MLKAMTAALAATAVFGLAACGNAEEAGENIDGAIEEATQGHENLGDGPMERAGESIDEATGDQRTDDAIDAIGDATDGRSDTNP